MQRMEKGPFGSDSQLTRPQQTSTFSNFNKTIQGRMRTEVSNFVRDFSRGLFREGLKNERQLEHWTGFQCLELLF